MAAQRRRPAGKPPIPERRAVRAGRSHSFHNATCLRARRQGDPNMASFSHLDENGGLSMVDVSAKPDTRRVAVAEAVVELSPQTLDMLRRAALPKGDVLTCAKVAGIMAAKRTSELIPLCHPLRLNRVDVRFEVLDDPARVRIETEAVTTGPTGVEMEALVAAQIAAATIYDMCKAVQRDIVINRVRLLRKEGGKSGVFQAPALD